jgi:hypothetical protein
MAPKKSRTPPPPRRPVQAPRRREGGPRKPPPVSSGVRRRRGDTVFYLVALGALAVVGGIIAAVVVLTGGSGERPLRKIDQSSLVGLMTAPAPWGANNAYLGDRLKQIHMPKLAAEGNVLHIHQHLDIYIHGKHVTTPAQIGIDPSGQFLTILHTHDATGIIHVESTYNYDFTLSQFFAVWGLRFDANHIGGYRVGDGNQLRVFVNGKRFSGDPRNVILRQHEEIAVSYGKPSELPKKLPSSYNFAARGL